MSKTTTPDPEEWRAVVGQEGRYDVSSLGRVRSLRFVNRHADKARVPPLILRPWSIKGYNFVWVGGERRQVSHLVAEAFVGERPDGFQVCHIDGNRSNDQCGNIEYGSCAENARQRVAHGTQARGATNGAAKLTDQAVREILIAGPGQPTALGRKYGVSDNTVRRVLKRKTWAHVHLTTQGEG